MRNTPHSERNTAVVSRILPAKIYSYLPTLLRSRYDSSLFFLEQGLVELEYSFVYQYKYVTLGQEQFFLMRMA